jgi:hypothetical protein
VTEITMQVVDDTWKEFSSLDDLEALDYIDMLGTRQPELMGFVCVALDDLDEELAELGMFVFLVVYRMFEVTFDEIRIAQEADVARSYDELEARLDLLEGAHEKFQLRSVQREIASQPAVIQYVMDALMEQHDEAPLADEEFGAIFIALRTAITVLAQMCEPGSQVSA